MRCGLGMDEANANMLFGFGFAQFYYRRWWSNPEFRITMRLHPQASPANLNILAPRHHQAGLMVLYLGMVSIKKEEA